MIIDISKKSDTINFAKKIAKQINTGTPILLYGTLGVGKTFFASHLIKALTSNDNDIPSPTFSLVQTYTSPKGEISHYDLYRISNPNELYELDINTSLENNITIIEWPEIIEDYIKENYSPLCLYFSNENGKRTITIK